MQIRKATMADVSTIHRLVTHYAGKGRMLHRPRAVLYEQLRDFAVAEDDDGTVIAAGALTVLWRDLAEIRATAVAPEARGRGVGRRLVEFLVEEARELGLNRICILTYEDAFFARCGFRRITKNEVPQKVFKECIYCDQFESCTEIPMMRHLERVPMADPPGAEDLHVQVPVEGAA